MIDKTKVYYLAGMMRPLPDHNFPEFERVSAMLRRDGFTIISPHEMGNPTMTRGELMTEDLLAILQQCDGIIAMEGWQDSSGASAEVAIAFATEKPVYDILFIHHTDHYVLEESETVTTYVPREKQYAEKIPLIGLCGYAQSGKDTVAKYLTENGWVRIAFADKLRDILYALNPGVEENLAYRGVGRELVRVKDLVNKYGWDKAKVTYTEIRELLQRLGTEAGRDEINSNLWVRLAEEKLERAGGPVVITDCRFENEMQFVERRRGALVWVDRPGVGPANAHASEHSVNKEDCDYILPNDGTLAQLGVRIKEMLEDLSEWHIS